MTYISNKPDLHELLAIVAEPETPEQRDNAWRRIEEQLEATRRLLHLDDRAVTRIVVFYRDDDQRQRYFEVDPESIGATPNPASRQDG